MAKVLLIDGNSWGHAAHHATKLTSGELQTQAVFGFLKTLRDKKAEHPGFTPLVLWDGRAKWRYDMHPAYKSNRDNDPKKVAEREHYKAQRPYIARCLEHLDVRQMSAPTHEADDLAGYMVAKLTAQPGNEIILSTGDMDWIQLVRPNVTWMDHRNDAKVVTVGNLMDKTGFPTPYAFLEGKCLTGDSSDVIPGVGGIGDKGAPEFIAEFGSVRKFWQRCDSGEFAPKRKAHCNLASPEGRAAFKRNFRLMQLLKVAAPDQKDVRVTPGKFDADKLAEVFEELAFTSILRTLDNFIKPFKGH
ncbi:MAG: 5'-3' exonuclease [Betaproteobacteria bacterium]|nr:5'-3' exonuclease [Betaproteobacteria bacterium]